MNNDKSFYPGFNDENMDRDKKMKDDLGAEVNSENLTYNEDQDSFEVDVKSTGEDELYDHPNPYDTSARGGSDFDSDYDEENIALVDDYQRINDGAEPEVNEYGMHIDDGQIAQLDPLDAELAKTPEDDRDDLDEEGYPKNDEDPLEGNEYLKS
ncbi:hypothetical protein [Pedobacter sp. SYSU D00535]|uniref:hypothetical protein n=1 Tax=Pedobacter sp. SYSU D00535 TaxID=2810308 RepID=UPI001F6073EF|nr:hypothetical protein [Pedobacter sp. SYSU D00535]